MALTDSPPSKTKLRLPQSSSSGTGYGMPPQSIPRQREPYLYPYKLPLVALTLTSLLSVLLSPWPRYQWLLWMLVFFSSCSLLSVVCQAIRMVNVVRRYRALYCSGAPSSTSSGGGAAQGSAAHSGGGGSIACSMASSPSSTSLSTCVGGGKDASTKMVVLEPSRPGHKKALRSKGHRSTNVSMDATGDCCDQLESVALVINCEDWSDSSGSGTDWAAGPPRWNHVFVIPNYKEVCYKRYCVSMCRVWGGFWGVRVCVGPGFGVHTCTCCAAFSTAPSTLLRSFLQSPPG